MPVLCIGGASPSLALWRCYLPFNGFLGVLWVFPRFRSLAASRGVFGACRGYRFFGAFSVYVAGSWFVWYSYCVRRNGLDGS